VIARMEKLSIAGPKRLAPALLQDLQLTGAVQIDSAPNDLVGEYKLSPERETRLRKWEAIATSADHTLRLLGQEPDTKVKPFDGDLDSAEATVARYEKRAGELVERRARLKAEIELIGYYSNIVSRLADAVHGLDESQRVTVLPFVVEREEDTDLLDQELESTLGDSFLFTQVPLQKLTACAIIIMKNDAAGVRGILARQGLSEIPRPAEYGALSLRAMASRFSERADSVPAEDAAAAEDLRRLAEKEGKTLQALKNRGENEAMHLQAFRRMASGRYGFALLGWVPSGLKAKVEETLHRFEGRTHYEIEPAEQHGEAGHVPVLLENPRWAKPFESLISFLNTPRYDSWDPTWIIAVLFPLWFGMIVGDVGYGLVFVGIAWYLSKYVKHERTLRIDSFKLRLNPPLIAEILGVLKPMIVWTFVWGLLYAEFFGDLPEVLGIFGTPAHPGFLPVLIPRTDTGTTANALILLSIGFGVIQVLHGFYVKARLMRRHGEKKHFWEAVGYLGGVTFLILFAWAFMAFGFIPWLVVPMSLCAGVFLWGMIRAGLPMMIAELPTQGGHILSYIRIYAVGLASAILANLSTDVGVGLAHQLGVVGIVVGILVGLVLGLLTHAILLVMLTVGHVLQPIRLIWVEFFTKFDFYTLNGRPYRPFRSVGDSAK
jgi:V/A-type H+/Na+-transporting ATPase subunit I